MKKSKNLSLAYSAIVSGLFAWGTAYAESPESGTPLPLAAQTATGNASASASASATTSGSGASASAFATSQALSTGAASATAEASASVQAGDSDPDGEDPDAGTEDNGGGEEGSGQAGNDATLGKNNPSPNRTAERPCTAISGSLATATVGNETQRDEQWQAVMDEDNCAANARSQARAIERGAMEED